MLLQAFHKLDDSCDLLHAFLQNVEDVKTGADDDGIDDDEFPFIPHETLVKINRLDEQTMHELLEI